MHKDNLLLNLLCKKQQSARKDASDQFRKELHSLIFDCILSTLEALYFGDHFKEWIKNIIGYKAGNGCYEDVYKVTSLLGTFYSSPPTKELQSQIL